LVGLAIGYGQAPVAPSRDPSAHLPFLPISCFTLPPGYHNIAQRFFTDAGFEHVALLAADGALEAAPAMGCADIILDLVSTGEAW
jgi:ATP phosphoribosyltransferase